MTFSRPTLKHALCIFAISFLLIGCTTTRTESFAPEFAVDNATIATQLQSMVSCEHINLNGVKTTVNDKDISYKLVVELLNPKDAGDRNELSKKIAAQLRQDLKDPGFFNSYKVCFTKKALGATASEYFEMPKDDLK